MSRCTACECHQTSKQVVFGTGNVKAKIVSVGEAPGPDEDEDGNPFIGRAGALYDKLLSEANIPRAKIWTDNTVKCFPGRNNKGGIQKPSPEAIDICTGKWLYKQLAIIKPRVILAWGLTAANALLVGNLLPMKDLVGQEIEVTLGSQKYIVVPLYHPSYFLRNSDDHISYGKVLTALQKAAVLAGFSSSGTFVDQVKTEHHQEDKSVITALEAKSGVFEVNPWRPDREYTQAWTDREEIWLIHKEPKSGKKKAEVIKDFEWYFYLRTHDALNKLPQKFWAKWLKDGLVHRLRTDPVNPAWTQVFADRHVVRTTALREHLLESYLTLWDDKTIKKYKEDMRLRDFLDEIESYGVQHYEADLTPTRRFMTDYDIKIQSAYDEMYMDIETDDTLPLGDRNTLGDRRILSIAWETLWADKGKDTKGFLLLKDENDKSERILLEEFAHEMDKIDIMYAWNGNNFDFPIVRHRMRRYKIQAPWEVIHTIDLLRTWIRYFQRGATVNTSYSLQNIAMHVLKQGKIDWKLRAKEMGLKIHTFLELYRQAPALLEEYNRDDCHKLVELERFTGFAKIDQVFSRIGNCFARDYHITTKIDSLLLKRGKQVGTHFRTKKIRIMMEGGKAAYKKSMYADGEVYEGAYVLDPEIGIHEDVAAVDFKGLYPSVMVAWNISPETYITDEQAKEMDPRDYTTCPTGTKFRVDRKGFVPEIFADTGNKRKVYQDLQKKEEVGSDLFLLYYRLAYSFKRLGLSFYGDMGNVESRYFHPKVAEAVTLSGQYVLKAAVEFAEREGVHPLYGDTDSMYIKIPRSKGEDFVKRFNSYFKKHLREKFDIPDERFIIELEYENYFSRMFFVRKKRYAGLMTMYKGADASFTEVKGLEMMRSDGIEYARVMQKTVIEMIVRESRGPLKILDFLLTQRDKVLGSELSLDEITITKAITKPLDQYKAKSVHLKIAEEFRQNKGEFYVGMKIPYVVTSGIKGKLEAVHVDNFTGEYDHQYYWSKLIYPATFRMLVACYPGVQWEQLFVGLTDSQVEKLRHKENEEREDSEDNGGDRAVENHGREDDNAA
jgi:uracil-DNA glycosylase family 4